MTDLRALVIGILSGTISGIIAYYAVKGIDRYLARRTTRSRKRQIEQLTQELQLLEKLGVTDRSLLLFAFRTLFLLIGIAVVGTAGAMALPFVNRPSADLTPLILFFVSFVIATVAFHAASVFRKLEDPEPTLAKLREKLRELQRIP